MLQVATAAEALVLLNDGPDALFLDLDLPGRGGLRLVDELNAKGRTIPVVLMSGDLGPHAEQRLRNGELEALLRKTVDLQEMRTGMARALATIEVSTAGIYGQPRTSA